MIRTIGIALAASSFLIAPTQAQTTNAQGQAQAQAAFELAQARSADEVILQLREAGFTIDAVTRTFLGRVRIEASNDTTVREVVVSRATGEILSDQVSLRAEASGGASATGTAASGGNAGGDATGSAETGVTASGGIAGGAVSGSASVGATASGGVGGGNAGGNSGAGAGVSVGGGLR